MGQIVLIVAGAVAVGLLAWWHFVRERQRQEALAAWCNEHAWGFDPKKIRSPGYDYDLFDRGRARYQRFTAKKQLDEVTPGLPAAAVRLFEYHYEITHGGGENSSTEDYYFTCALVDPGLDLGAVGLRREGWGDKLVQAIGFDDIDFEDPEFSKRFVVEARDRKDAYDLFDGAMMRYLCDHADYGLETRGRALLVHERVEASPESFDALARFLRGFLAQLPRPLVNAERSRRGLAPLLEAGNASTSSRQALDKPGGQRNT